MVLSGMYGKKRVKQRIKKILADWYGHRYDKLLEKKTVSYDAWIREMEKGRKERRKGNNSLKVKPVPYEACSSFCLGKTLPKETADIILFMDSNGKASEFAEEAVAEYFSEHSDIRMLYGDEDVLSPEGIRYTPWFKPDWSPDTFLSFFYFGSIFAVRTELLRELTMEEKRWILEMSEGDGREDIYRMCYILALKCGGFEKRRMSGGEKEGEWNFPIGHLDEVLFHGKANQEMALERVKAFDFLMEAGGRKNLVTKQEYRRGNGAAMLPTAEGKGQGKLSVVIPSKDNGEVLKRCIHTLTMEAGRGWGKEYEIIIVDNGGEEDTKRELEDWLKRQGILYTYLYKEMPFHFSKMCNMGAEAAGGEVLLFLNDDVEIPDFSDREKENFLEELYCMACRPYTGAVGAKLYYPNSARIQHAGIVNLKLGPVHKLQFKEDNISYYYGWNRRRRNVIAVTGACLAVEKEKFWEAGGFPEDLPVAFNDVDLCFSLFEKGYYNVALQDFALYHYESLSRGNDDEREKLERLLNEKDKLYERHPHLYGEDPFYHRNLASDMLSTGFDLKADYELEEAAIHAKAVGEEKLLEGAREDACIIISLEYAGPIAAFRGRDEGKELFLQGYSFVSGSDNALFEKMIILGPEEDAEENGGKLMYIRPEILRRKDVEENLPDQANVGLTGFAAVIDGESLAKGGYRIGMLARDKCSGQKIYSWTNRYLQVGGDCEA